MTPNKKYNKSTSSLQHNALSLSLSLSLLFTNEISKYCVAKQTNKKRLQGTRLLSAMECVICKLNTHTEFRAQAGASFVTVELVIKHAHQL